MKTPIAVLISDVHFTVPTLELASKSLQMALDKAVELRVPVIIAGDLLDSKAIMRGEVVNKLIEILSDFNYKQPNLVYIIRGNHDSFNERDTQHSLTFLEPYVEAVVDTCNWLLTQNIFLLSYQHDVDTFRKYISQLDSGTIVVCHQGFQGAQMGHYITDKSSIHPDEVKHLRVISGHYHKRQDIGTISYIGNPYTLSFGEAYDGEKGFRVLLSDGSLDFVPTALRKHVVVEHQTEVAGGGGWSHTGIGPDDLVWVKVRGPKSKLDTLIKADIAYFLNLPNANFKLDLIPTDTDNVEATVRPDSTAEQVLDSLIDSLGETDTRKQTLKSTWRGLLDGSTER